MIGARILAVERQVKAEIRVSSNSIVPNMYSAMNRGNLELSMYITP